MRVSDYKVGSIVSLDILEQGVDEWLIVRHSNGIVRAISTKNEDITLTERSLQFNKHVRKVLVY